MSTRRKKDVKADLVNRCVLLHHDLMKGGMYATGQKMHEVVRMAGWELANDVEGYSRIERKARARSARSPERGGK